MQVWFLPAAWKRAWTSGIWRRFRSALGAEATQGDLARLARAPEVVALATEPSAILILCDRVDPDLAAFGARFIQAPICLVTETPGLEAEVPPDVGVHRGPVGDRHWLHGLAAYHGPNLVIDQRADDPYAQARAFAVLRPRLARGGAYALRTRSGLTARLRSSRALDQRLAATGMVDRRAETGYRIVAAPGASSTPIRVRPASGIAGSHVATVPAPAYRRAEADLVDAPAWIADAVATYAGRTVTPPEARVHRFQDAIVFGYGLVQVGDSLVEESLINRDRSAYLGALTLGPDGEAEVRHTLPRPRRIAGRSVHLWQLWGENYGHWLIECLPRLHVAARAGLLDGARVTVQAMPGMEGLYRDSLAAFGIGPDRIVWLNQREVVFEELIYPSPITRQPIVKSPLVIEAALHLRDRIGPPEEALPERIYVSRNRSGRRRLANEAEVIALLAERGYRVVHPEAEPFARQVRIFAAARFVVGGMGAALANLAFGPDGLRCLMLTNRDMLDDFFLDLAGLKAGRYVSIHGTSLSPELGMQSDYTIDLDTLRETLDRHGF